MFQNGSPNQNQKPEETNDNFVFFKHAVNSKTGIFEVLVFDFKFWFQLAQWFRGDSDSHLKVWTDDDRRQSLTIL